MNLIVAVDRKNGIGKNEKLLTYLPIDLKFFKSMTRGKIIIMGRKTIDSLPKGKLLPNRTTWILTQDLDYKKEGAEIFHSIDDILAYIQKEQICQEDIFVAGGSMIYEAFLPFCDCAYITLIDYDFDADLFIPSFHDLPDWYLTYVSESHTYGNYVFNFTQYHKKHD